MLRKNFLRILSDWVQDALGRHPDELERAANEFKFDTLIRFATSEKDEDTLAGLFGEWLVFDRKSACFNDVTGLEYFVKHNPLRVPENDMVEYRELLSFEAGFFIVKDTRMGVLMLEAMDGRLLEVHDVSMSMMATQGQTLWSRIARVGGVMHCVGSAGFSMSVSFGANMRSVIANEWGRIDARDAAAWFCDKKNIGEEGKRAMVAKQFLSEESAARAFDAALADCGMQKMLSHKTVKCWVGDNRRFSPTFPMKALQGLMPEDISKPQTRRLMNTLSAYQNALPRREHGGKSPNEKALSSSEFGKQFDVEFFSLDRYWKMAQEAHEHIRAHDAKAALVGFEKTVRLLLKDSVPLFAAFRIFANAAVACFNHQNELKRGLGEALVRAALRLNPQYEFGRKLKEQHIDTYANLSAAPRKDWKMLRKINDFIYLDGERQYARSVFSKYERFITETCGVSLNRKSQEQTTIYNKEGGEVKIGRNDPCYCGNGKKYKKCHGV